MIKLLGAELKRIWTEFIRYPVDSISVVLITTIIFYGLFLSASYIAGPSALALGNRLDAIVVGYVLWFLVTFIIGDIALGLQAEAQTGTLEQVLLSPFGVLKIFLARAIASLTLRLSLIVGILSLIMLITGSHLYFPPSLFLPLFTVLLGAYGLAFIAGSLALLFKRVQQLLGLLQFVLLFMLAVPTEGWSGPLKIVELLIPMTLGASLLRDLMAQNQSLDFSQLGLALLNGVGYFALGVFIFHWAERRAKRQGILGGY